jgi:hypothetical protein
MGQQTKLGKEGAMIIDGMTMVHRNKYLENMKKHQEIENLIADIWYQNPRWPSTFSVCCNGCGNSARGGRECIYCLEIELSKLTSQEDARSFVSAVRQVLTAEESLREHSKPF